MRVLVATTAGAGHFGPIEPFADACRRAGHDVLVAAPRSFAPTIQRAGFELWPCDDAPEQEWRAVMSRLPSLSFEEANALVVGEVFAGIDARSVLPRMLEAIDEWRPDVVLREDSEYGSYLAAESRGVPHVRGAVGLGVVAERFLPIAAEALADLRDSIGLDADETGERLRRSPAVSLVPRSFEDPAAPGSSQTLRFRDGRPATPEPLPDWWPGNDDPLVYVTFGSVTATIPTFASVYKVVVDAFADLSARLLVTVGEGLDPASLGAVPANVHVESWVPQKDVAPLARALVCHGGFGTVLGALASGVPMVVAPLFADQPDNARQVAAVGAGISLGVGPPDAAALRDSLSKVLADDSFRSAAGCIAADVRALPSTDEAVPALRDIAGVLNP